MSSQENGVDQTRRWLAIGATSVVGAVGAGFVAVPFVKSWNPSAKAKAAGAPVTVDIGKLEVGQKMLVEWRSKPVWVVRRSEEALNRLEGVESKLRDPNSEVDQQPAYAKNRFRSREDHKAIIVMVGLCTHLGCSPSYRPEITEDWSGGFFCPCHGSKFDFSGRVFSGVPAPTNLVIPPYSFSAENKDILVVGVDEENA
jgi:ubiquinol-cytochrome c reductase iron-sulfur subunit